MLAFKEFLHIKYMTETKGKDLHYVSVQASLLFYTRTEEENC